MSDGFCLFTGYLNHSDDVEKFKKEFNVIAKTACQPQSKDACRNLWYSLTGSRQHRNIYSVPLPFHIKVVMFEDNRRVKFCAYIFSKNANVEGSENVVNKNDAVISVSATLLLQIKQAPADEHAVKKDIWEVPRDFNLLCDEPAPKCFVELGLVDCKYVSHTSVKAYDESIKKPTFFEYVLSKSPDLVQQTWHEFKETFLSDEEPK